MEKEMNFFDLCVVFGRAVGRFCRACWRLMAHMLRLTYRYWWVVVTIVILAIAAALYYTREQNIINRVNGVVMVNTGSLQQFEQAFAPLRSGKMLPEGAPITAFWKEHKASAFTTFHVIDCKHDEVSDFVDFKNKVKASDTSNVVMQDRVCVQFRVKTRDLHLLPEMEQALMDYLNANEAMQQSYVTYLQNLRKEVAFNHSQAHKLDSLTSHYYFRGQLGTDSFGKMQQGTVVMSDFGGDWRIVLFLNEIYEQHEHLRLKDYRLQLATAPAVLENHFTVDPKPVNGRLKSLIIFFLFGWIFGCAIAELIDKREAINEWLKAS